MKKVLLALLCIGIFSLCSCNIPSQETKEEENFSFSRSAVEKMEYFKDSRTNLCFAAFATGVGLGSQIITITCVPCDSLKNVEVHKIE